MDPTTIGIWLFFAYPPLVLAYDGLLKFALKRPTITAEVVASPKLKAAAVAHMLLWFTALTLHFGLGWFDG